MRLIWLPSEGLGQDWAEKTQMIDKFLVEEGFDLAEESIYLLFNRAPGSIQNGIGECQIGRSVIGPKKALNGEFGLLDWVSAPVHREKLSSGIWSEIYPELVGHWEKLQIRNVKISSQFILKLSRELKPDLKVDVEVFFHGQ